MSKDIIISKIELCEAQIENLERSGYFTAKEIDIPSNLLRLEVEALKAEFKHYGMTYEQYLEGSEKHTSYFSRIPSPALLNTWNELGRNLSIGKG